MSRLTKGIRKLKRNVKHVIGKKAWNFGKGFLDVATLGANYGIRKAGEEYNRNETLYNTLALSIGAGLLSGGALGALGLAGGLGAGGAAATGAALGATAGLPAGMQMQATEDAIKEQERVAEQAAAEQERLAKLQALKDAGATPSEQSNLDISGRKRTSSQYRRNIVSRDKNKKVGGTSTKLG